MAARIHGTTEGLRSVAFDEILRLTVSQALSTAAAQDLPPAAKTVVS
jgi:hypothetical protein